MSSSTGSVWRPTTARNRAEEARVLAHRLRHEWQRLRRGGNADERGIDVGDVVAEPPSVAGAAIVALVGVQHEDLAWKAVARRAPIIEGLNAGRRDAHRVGVVPVRGERMAAEVGAHAPEPGT